MDAIAEARFKHMVLVIREDIRRLNRRVYALELQENQIQRKLEKDEK